MLFMLLVKGVIGNLITASKIMPTKMSYNNQTRRKRPTVALPSRLNMAAAGRAPAVLPSGFFRFGGEVV